MPLHTEWVQVNTGDKQHRLYTSRLSNVKTPLPVVLVIQEIWGTDGHILDVADRFAKAGYLAVAPDLYAENGERPEALQEQRIEQVKEFLNTLPPGAWHDPAVREQKLETLPASQREQIRSTFEELFGGLSRLPERLETLRATMRFLETYEFSRGQKVASVGFCMGGALSALLAAAEPSLSGAVVYYGHLPDKQKLQAIQCPVAGFFGRLDERITSQVPAFAEEMKKAGKTFTYEIYEGASHAFFNDTRASYHVAAARDAWVKTLQFMHRVLV